MNCFQHERFPSLHKILLGITRGLGAGIQHDRAIVVFLEGGVGHGAVFYGLLPVGGRDVGGDVEGGGGHIICKRIHGSGVKKGCITSTFLAFNALVYG